MVCGAAFPAVTVTVAGRVEVFGFGSALNTSVAPLWETFSQDWLELADQLLWLVVTATLVEETPAAGFHDDMESDSVGAGGGKQSLCVHPPGERGGQITPRPPLFSSSSSSFARPRRRTSRSLDLTDRRRRISPGQP
jgi:hypothetical protein